MTVKAKRIPRPDADKVNDYLITCPGGAEIWALSNGKGKFNCAALNLENQAIKTIKAAASWYRGSGDNAAVAAEPTVPEVGVEPVLEPEPGQPVGTFDCAHPCVWILTKLLPPGSNVPMPIWHTLDKYGYLAEDNLPDYDRANRELDAWTSWESQRCAAMKG